MNNELDNKIKDLVTNGVIDQATADKITEFLKKKHEGHEGLFHHGDHGGLFHHGDHEGLFHHGAHGETADQAKADDKKEHIIAKLEEELIKENVITKEQGDKIKAYLSTAK
ncbi:MAG: hypothetical protein FWC47_02785 [Oscillospiraceae bacterium]|nr:hypothetical protein [Oscillospiraceae bacterium]